MIKNLLEIAKLYLKLKNCLFYYEIRQKSRQRQTEIINEIEELRTNGDSDSADRADLLRQQLRSEKQELKHLSAFYTKAQSK